MQNRSPASIGRGCQQHISGECRRHAGSGETADGRRRCEADFAATVPLRLQISHVEGAEDVFVGVLDRLVAGDVGLAEDRRLSVVGLALPDRPDGRTVGIEGRADRARAVVRLTLVVTRTKSSRDFTNSVAVPPFCLTTSSTTST